MDDKWGTSPTGDTITEAETGWWEIITEDGDTYASAYRSLSEAVSALIEAIEAYESELVY